MKLSLHAVLAAILALPLLSHAQSSAVRVRVEQQSGSDSDKFTTTQRKSLKVFVSNSSKETLTGLKVKYYYVGRDVKDRDVKIIGKGEQAADVQPLATTLVETPASTAKSTDKHSEGGTGNSKSKGGKSSKNNKPAKAIPASGEKFIGYGVQVLDASGKVLAEAYDPLSMKQEIAGK